MWEAGMVADLSFEGRSPTDLARGRHGLSYHQINRRAGLFKIGGLLEEWQGAGRRRCYGLSEKTRRKMGLLAGIARWRDRHVVARDEEGMTAAEMATVLRVALPLVRLPGHEGRSLLLEVRGESEAVGSEEATVWAMVQEDGTVCSCAEPPAEPSGWGRGDVATWIAVLLDGDVDRVMLGEDEQPIADILSGLYEALWSPQLI